MTDKQLFAAIRALPLMTAKKLEDEYRVTLRLDAIRQARPDWSIQQASTYAEQVSYYTNDREDALSTAQSLSAWASNGFAAS